MSSSFGLVAEGTFKEGRRDDAIVASRALVDHVLKNCAGVPMYSFNFYGNVVRVVEVYDDVAAFLAKGKDPKTRELMRPFFACLASSRYTVFGNVTPELRKTLSNMKNAAWPDANLPHLGWAKL